MARIFLTRARMMQSPLSNFGPPLGLMYLAAALRDAGHQVCIHDMGANCHDPRQLGEELARFAPDLVGISAQRAEMRCLGNMAAEIRRRFPGLPVVAGGPLATSDPEGCLRASGVDFVVLGEGEHTIVELVAALQEPHADPRAVPGICCLGADGALRRGAPRAPIADLDALPMPAWDMIDIRYYQRYSQAIILTPERFPVLSSRGCPWHCSYCHDTHGKAFRAHSPQRVIDEIRFLKEHYGAQDIAIIDDIFNYDRERMREVLERIIASDLGVTLSFPNALRSDMLDRELIFLLREAGTRVLIFAVETATPRLQRLIHKRLHLGKVRENMEHAREAGLFTGGYFMLGFPTETAREARDTIDFAARSPLHFAAFSLVIPFPGTELFAQNHELLERRGFDAGDESIYSKRSCNLSAISDRQLTRLHKTAYLRFYLDPARIARIWSDYPYSKRMLLRQSRYTFEALTPAWLHKGGASTPYAPVVDLPECGR